MIALAIVAPTYAMRAGLAALLGADAGLAVVAAAASLAELRQRQRPGVHGGPSSPADVLLIVREALVEAELERWLAESSQAVALLVIGGRPETARGLQRLPLRAWGLLLEDSSAEELAAAARALHQGLLVGAPVLLEPLLAQLVSASAIGEPLAETLTSRETELLQHIAQGLANKQIALALGISEHTVKFHLSSIYAKLGATSRTEAVRIGARHGMIVL